MKDEVKPHDGDIERGGFVFTYEVTDHGSPGVMTGNPDNWEPPVGVSWELTSITDTETDMKVDWSDVVATWAIDKDEARAYIDMLIDRRLNG